MEDVQDTYEDQLMKIDGIEGMGICVRDGEPCFVIYTDKPTRKIKLNNQDLEEYKIVYEYLGKAVRADDW